MKQQSKFIALGGGINERDRGLQMPSGHLLRGWNVEQKSEGGYRRVLGYSKYDDNIVPGSGQILGVWNYNGKVYAFRNETDGLSAVMYESAGSGWTSRKPNLSPDGRYEFENSSMTGYHRMYGVSGVHKAFEFDTTAAPTWTDVTTGMTTDEPTHLAVHRKHLILSFGPSMQISPVGDPAGTWTLKTGAAAEILMDGDITAFSPLTGGVLGVMSRNATSILAGTGLSSWDVTALSEHGNAIGCIEWSLQQMGSRVHYWDDRGIVDFYTTDRYGDFSDATLSQIIPDTFKAGKKSITASCVVREKSQYRTFFDDGNCLIGTFNQDKMVGWTIMRMPIIVRCVCSTEDSSGIEKIYFGSDDGYIYQMESGNSWDGVAIEAYMKPAFAHLKSPRQRKRFRRAVLDIQSQAENTGLMVKPEFLFDQPQLLSYQDPIFSGVSNTDPLGEFILGTSLLGSGTEVLEGIVDIPGTGAFVTLNLFSNEIAAPWEIGGIMYEFLPGRERRG